MSYSAFRRQAVPQQFAQALQTLVIPAPTRGLIQSENEAYMQPGGALVQDNWAPTMRGVKLRGGCIRWCDLHALDATVPPVPDPARLPVISAFEYKTGNTEKMFAANAQKLFDVTAATPVLIRSGHGSGNYVAAQFSNAATSGGPVNTQWMLICNDAGDAVMRYNGVSWVTLTGAAGAASDGASHITGPAGTPVALGNSLVYVWKYRGRLYFIEAGTLNVWYLPIDAVGGALTKIPLAGAASKGGKLLFGAVYSTDAGDGLDDKNVLVTDQGEVLIFTGSNPADPANWRQEGRWEISPPLGMNAHIQIGGDLLILTVDGIVPISQAIARDRAQLELALITRDIKPIWRHEVAEKRSWPWTIKKWDEYGAMFVTTPGGRPGQRGCLVVNNVTGAWCRFRDGNYDPTCFIRMGADMFFGTQNGIVMQAERTGTDDGMPYVASLIGGWEMFGAPANVFVWLQARASFHAGGGQMFKPQLSACVNYEIVLPTPPPAGPDPPAQSVWDRGLWDQALWDQATSATLPIQNTGWISIGKTGFAHAPVVQVTVAQTAPPDVEMIAIAATYTKAGVNV